MNAILNDLLNAQKENTKHLMESNQLSKEKNDLLKKSNQLQEDLLKIQTKVYDASKEYVDIEKDYKIRKARLEHLLGKKDLMRALNITDRSLDRDKKDGKIVPWKYGNRDYYTVDYIEELLKR